MRMEPKNATVQLEAWQPFAFRNARGVRVECVAGRVWLTVEGEGGDHYLVAGEGRRLRGNGLALIEGMPSGSVRLVAPSPWPLQWIARLWNAVSRGGGREAVAAGATVISASGR